MILEIHLPFFTPQLPRSSAWEAAYPVKMIIFDFPKCFFLLVQKEESPECETFPFFLVKHCTSAYFRCATDRYAVVRNLSERQKFHFVSFLKGYTRSRLTLLLNYLCMMNQMTKPEYSRALPNRRLHRRQK